MKKILLHVLFLTITTWSILGYAKEPANLVVAKQIVKRYHDTGEYDKDIANTIQHAMRYLEWRIKQSDAGQKKLAIILDIDETSLSNYADLVDMDFGGTLAQIREAEDKGEDPAITPTLKLFQFAKAHHIAVFFLTGRMEEERAATIKNLEKVGFIGADGLILRDGEYRKKPASIYKSAMRKHLTADGYEIVLNIGDQYSDLTGEYTGKTFKLPNPFYIIP